jgi:hypothetical protein
VPQALRARRVNRKPSSAELLEAEEKRLQALASAEEDETGMEEEGGGEEGGGAESELFENPLRAASQTVEVHA